MAARSSKHRSALARTFTFVRTIAALAAACAASTGGGARAAEGAAAFSIADEPDSHFGRAAIVLLDGNRVAISADVTVSGAGGRVKTSRLTAVVVGRLAPGSAGFMDYTDDACMNDVTGDVAQTSPTLSAQAVALRACAAIGRAWNAYLDLRLPAVSPSALLYQTAGTIELRDGTAVGGTLVFSGDAYDNEMGITTQR
jgi:hypothetical protein